MIDDEQTMRTLLEFFLGAKHEVTSVGTAKEALTWLDSNLPNLIISDIQMPEMDGFEFLEKVRLRGYTKQMHKIMNLGVILPFEHNNSTLIINDFINNLTQLSAITFC